MQSWQIFVFLKFSALNWTINLGKHSLCLVSFALFKHNTKSETDQRGGRTLSRARRFLRRHGGRFGWGILAGNLPPSPTQESAQRQPQLLGEFVQWTPSQTASSRGKIGSESIKASHTITPPSERHVTKSTFQSILRTNIARTHTHFGHTAWSENGKRWKLLRDTTSGWWWWWRWPTHTLLLTPIFNIQIFLSDEANKC